MCVRTVDTHTHTHKYARTHTHTKTHTHTHTRARAREHIYTHTRTHTRIHAHTHIHTHAHTHTLTHTHAHAHTHRDLNQIYSAALYYSSVLPPDPRSSIIALAVVKSQRQLAGSGRAPSKLAPHGTHRAAEQSCPQRRYWRTKHREQYCGRTAPTFSAAPLSPRLSQLPLPRLQSPKRPRQLVGPTFVTASSPTTPVTKPSTATRRPRVCNFSPSLVCPCSDSMHGPKPGNLEH